MADFNISIASEIPEKQAAYLFSKAYTDLGTDASTSEINAYVNELIHRYYTNLGRPLHVMRPVQFGHLPFIEEYNDQVDEITADIGILYGETEKIGSYLSNYFNYAKSEELRLQQRMKSLTSLTDDMSLVASETAGNTIYFRDSFNDASHIDIGMTVGTAAQVSTIEGIVTLARTDSINLSSNAKISLLQGNGYNGTQYLVRQVQVTSDDGQSTTIQPVFVSEQTPNDNPTAIYDGKPDTLFEYEMVNCPKDTLETVAQGYDVDYMKGDENTDTLIIRLILELPEQKTLNWININPYYPAQSTGEVTIQSIRTSTNGIDYTPLFEGNEILNAELNNTADSYRADSIYTGSNNPADTKFTGQGVWSFPSRSSKYIEIVATQNQSYPELIGHTYYELIKTSQDSNGNDIKQTTRVPASQVPDDVVTDDPGTYVVDDTLSVHKGIEMFNGWRYVIGLRDVNLMSYEFETQSQFVSERYTTDQPIKEVLLYANEKIPESYLTDVSKGNDWIKYYISVDDLNWIQISPQHHQPLADNFPPKIISFNANEVDYSSSMQLYKGYQTTTNPVTGIRLKVVISRPTDDDSIDTTQSIYKTTTPILEDYALRVVFADTEA